MNLLKAGARDTQAPASDRMKKAGTSRSRPSSLSLDQTYLFTGAVVGFGAVGRVAVTTFAGVAGFAAVVLAGADFIADCDLAGSASCFFATVACLWAVLFMVAWCAVACVAAGFAVAGCCGLLAGV